MNKSWSTFSCENIFNFLNMPLKRMKWFYTWSEIGFSYETYTWFLFYMLNLMNTFWFPFGSCWRIDSSCSQGWIPSPGLLFIFLVFINSIYDVLYFSFDSETFGSCSHWFIGWFLITSLTWNRLNFILLDLPFSIVP